MIKDLAPHPHSFNANKCIQATLDLEKKIKKAPAVEEELRLFEDLGKEAEGKVDVPITPELLKAYFKDPQSSQYLRACAAASMQSRQIHLFEGMRIHDNRRFVADEYLTTFSHVDSSFAHLGPFDLGDAMPDHRPGLHRLHPLTPSAWQHLIINHSHPSFNKEQILGPSVITEHKDATGTLLEPGDDLVGIYHSREKRAKMLQLGYRPNSTKRPIWGIVQSGDSAYEPVKMLWFRESETLARLDKAQYFFWLRENAGYITEAKNDTEIVEALKRMGYLCSWTAFEGPYFWFVPNIFIDSTKDDLLRILNPQPESPELEHFINYFGL